MGEAGSDRAGEALAIADLDGDLTPDFLVTAPGHSAGRSRAGAVYVFSSDAAALDRLDGVDGSVDGLIDISHVGRTDGWKIDGAGHGDIRRVAVAGDVDGDSRDDLLITFWNQPGPGSAYLLLGSALPTLLSAQTSTHSTQPMAKSIGPYYWAKSPD